MGFVVMALLAGRGFLLESRYALTVVAEGFRKGLDGDTTAQLRVSGLIDLSHAARSQVAGDLIMCEFRADHDVTRMRGRILSNNPHVTHTFETQEKVRGSVLSWRETCELKSIRHAGQCRML
jgi:hypothetical protein